jgi:hypothetical protein
LLPFGENEVSSSPLSVSFLFLFSFLFSLFFFFLFFSFLFFSFPSLTLMPTEDDPQSFGAKEVTIFERGLL